MEHTLYFCANSDGTLVVSTAKPERFYWGTSAKTGGEWVIKPNEGKIFEASRQDFPIMGIDKLKWQDNPITLKVENLNDFISAYEPIYA